MHYWEHFDRLSAAGFPSVGLADIEMKSFVKRTHKKSTDIVEI